MKRIDGIYRKPIRMVPSWRMAELGVTPAVYNYWGKIPDKTNNSPRLQLPDYMYERLDKLTDEGRI